MGIFDKFFGNVNQEIINQLKLELEGILNVLHEAAIVSETDIRGNITFANERFCKVTGYTVDELMGKNHRILKSGLHDDSVYVDMWKTISQDKKVWKGLVSNKKKNGEIYWVQATVAPVLDSKGIPIKYVSIRFEVTDLVKKEEELKQISQEIQSHEEELRQSTEELLVTNEHLMQVQNELNMQFQALNNAAIVSITDIRGNITYVNDTFCKISKYSKQELLGQNHRILKSGDQPQVIFDEMWKTISSGKVWHGIIKNKAKDDTYYWVHSTITPILDANNLIEKYIAIRFDISSEKELESLFHGSKESIESLNSSLALAKEGLEKKVESMESDLHLSLNYAKRLQYALIPTPTFVRNHFPEEFQIEILLKPREKVSGDFYWFDLHNNKSVFFMGDATGHGVPGAFMSILGLESIHKIVKDKGVYLPDMILGEMDNDIRNKLHQNSKEEQTVEDTLEGTALMIEGSKMWVSSAMRPFVVVKNDGILEEHNPTKKTIGGTTYSHVSGFDITNLNLISGDTLYLFSDGYKDQLGGPSGTKKLGKQTFYEYLVSLNEIESLSKRNQMLYKKFEDWKGFFQDQNDDVIVVMIRKR